MQISHIYLHFPQYFEKIIIPFFLCHCFIMICSHPILIIFKITYFRHILFLSFSIFLPSNKNFSFIFLIYSLFNGFNDFKTCLCNFDMLCQSGYQLIYLQTLMLQLHLYASEMYQLYLLMYNLVHLPVFF